jgi:RNA polymerase sigma factor (sigma-70 family)
MLGGSRGEAEDVLQDVFVRAYAALRSNGRPISLRAWLYRIAHNRCIDEMRRPWPVPSEISNVAVLALSRGHRHDPADEIERSEQLTRLVADVQALPDQQRSALLMRELQGLSYEELGCALGISVAAVKSLLLRARAGLIDAATARDTPCEEIRLELTAAHDRGVRAGGRARRHMRECESCRTYRGELRSLRRNLAALVPTGPLGHLGMLLGLGGGGASGGLAAGGGGGAAALGGAATVTATKVATLVCCAALVGAASTALQPAAHPARPSHPRPVLRPAVHRAVLLDARRSRVDQRGSAPGGPHFARPAAAELQPAGLGARRSTDNGCQARGRSSRLDIDTDWRRGSAGVGDLLRRLGHPGIQQPEHAAGRLRRGASDDVDSR